jgi:hypothetical protein
MSTTTPEAAPAALAERFRCVRQCSLAICKPLTPEDMMIQSTSEASPVKWHLAHTAWFFESFVLREFLPAHRLLHAAFTWLFTSSSQSFGSFPVDRNSPRLVP